MISHPEPTDVSLLHLRTDISWALIILGENHNPEDVATALMDKLGANYNQTGVAGKEDFLTGPYWLAVSHQLTEAEQKDPFHAPDSVSWVYTNEFILAEELQESGYTPDEAVEVISKMREKENLRQDMLHRAANVSSITHHPAHPEMVTDSGTRVLATHE